MSSMNGFCKRCNSEYTKTHHLQQYCARCKAIIEQEKEAAKGAPKSYGEAVCDGCGKTYVKTNRMQKYCPECQEARKAKKPAKK